MFACVPHGLGVCASVCVSVSELSHDWWGWALSALRQYPRGTGRVRCGYHQGRGQSAPSLCWCCRAGPHRAARVEDAGGAEQAERADTVLTGLNKRCLGRGEATLNTVSVSAAKTDHDLVLAGSAAGSERRGGRQPR